MPPVPPACQSFADQVSALEQQYSTLATQAEGLVGGPAWAALARLGTLLQQLTSARDDLARCVKTPAALIGTLVVIDASGDAPAGQQTVTLWDLVAGGATAREVSPVEAGAFGFQGPLPASAALTVQTVGVADLRGLDFRSGALDGPLDGQAPRVEIVIGPQLTLPKTLLVDQAAAFKPVSQSGLGSGGGATFDVAIDSLSVALASGTITVTATGVLSGAFAGLQGGHVAMSAAIALAIVPAVDPQTDDIASVALAGPDPISVSTTGGPALAGAIASTLAPYLGPLVQNALQSGVNEALAAAVAGGLAIARLPAGTRVSLRTIMIDETGISFQPALGLIGTGLSTFKPVPLPLPTG